MIHHGDLFEVLPTLDAESIDACVTDPPYGIGFMGREWDTFKPEVANQKQGLRQINKSESHTRQAKRLINPNLKGRTVDGAISSIQIEYDYTVAGLRRFQQWCELWGREVYRVLKPGGYVLSCGAPRAYHRMASGLEDAGFEIRDCLAWVFGQGFPKSLNLGDGLGTALKPSHEPIVLARKPFKGSVRSNVERYGTGALNIDACRVGTDAVESHGYPGEDLMGAMKGRGVKGSPDYHTTLGRWPANVVLDEIAALVLDEMTGDLDTCGGPKSTTHDSGMFGIGQPGRVYEDSGGAARFFYCAKPSREERDMGCYSLPPRPSQSTGWSGESMPQTRPGRTVQTRQMPIARNTHPTVKPVELMRWLIRLVTPPGGTVLDPFLGSGTTGMAARYEFREFVGIEREAEYVEIAERRIASVAPLFVEPVSAKPAADAESARTLFDDGDAA